MVQQFIAGYAIFLVIVRSSSTCVKSDATYWSVTSTNNVGKKLTGSFGVSYVLKFCERDI